MNPDQKLRQLVNRLQNSSTSSERVDALYDLQGLARSNPAEVGSQALHLILELLKDQGSVEEYQECLELISRLLKTNVDHDAAVANASMVVAETGNIEIFLELLEHEDGLIGIMGSDLLRDIHAVVPAALEKAIHDCPAGMNKLLHRVADRSREEVGNQALVLIQQLTLTNEEMKKTVAFNEGFDILFNIITQEGGVSDPGVVVEDCLRVCCNILDESEICQRLFYSMGSAWRHTLLGFFDPEQLENGAKSYLEDEDEPVVSWFDQPTRLSCAILAMTALTNSLGSTPPEKHQLILAKEFDGIVISTAMFWCARNGPVDLIPLSLNLLKAIVVNNPETMEAVKSAYLIIGPAKKGVHVPLNYEPTALAFGNKIAGSNDKIAIAVPSLLVEKYISNDSNILWSNILRGQDTHTPVYGSRFSSNYLEALDVFLAVDPMSAGMILQYVLAPMPPSPDDEFGEVDTGKPFGSLVLQLLVESCNKVLQHLNNTALTVTPSATDISNAQKCANVFTLILIHGGALARELASAIHISHVMGSSPTGNVSLLPFILSVVARVVKMPHGHGLSVSLLRVLCAAAASCETSCKLMLDNPSNLFVVDLAVLATGQESSPVLYDVYSYSCFFLGTCLQALPDSSGDGVDSAKKNDGDGPGVEGFHVSRKMLLGIIDSKIGLTHFTDALKRRVTLESKVLSQSTSTDDHKFHALEHLRSSTFVAFMNLQREAIRKAIYDHYSGCLPTGNDGNAESSALSKIVELQKEEIVRLTSELEATKGGGTAGVSADFQTKNDAPIGDESPTMHGLIESVRLELSESQEKCKSLESELVNAAENVISLNSIIDELKNENSQLRESSDRNIEVEQAALSERSQWQEKLIQAGERIEELEREMNSLRQKTLSDAASLLESENLISELKDEVVESRQELSTRDDTISTLKVEVSALEDRIANSTTEKHNYEYPAEGDLVVSLKEQIVALSNDKKKLREELDKANRSIELMEEELRGPIPYEKSRESKISDLESRNSSLKKQIWQLEGELEASKTAAFDGCYNIAEVLKPAFVAITDGFDDTKLLTLELDQNRESSTIGVEALTAFISADISTCCDLVGRCFHDATEYYDSSHVDEGKTSELATLKALLLWVTNLIDSSRPHGHVEPNPAVSSVTAGIIESLQNELDDALHNYQDADAHCIALESEVSQLKTAIGELEGVITSGNGGEERAALEFEIVRLKATIAGLESANSSHTESMQQSEDRCNALADEVDQLRAEVSALSDVNASLGVKNSDTDVDAAAASILIELDELKRKNATTELCARVATEAIVFSLSSLHAALGSGESSFSTNGDIDVLANSLRTAVEGITKKLGDASASIEKLNTTVVRYEQNAIIHEDELDDLKQQCSDFYERTHEHDDLLAKFEQMVSDFSVAEEKISHFNEVIAKLEYDNEQLTIEKEKNLACVSQLELDLRDTSSALSEQTVESTRLTDEIGRLKDALEANREQIVELEASKHSCLHAVKLQVMELEEKLLIAETEKRDIENRSVSEKEPLAKVVASLRAERDALKKELHLRDKEVKETTAECASLGGRVAGFTAAFEGLQEEFESVRDEKDALEKDYSSASQKVAELTNANSLLESSVASRVTEIEELKAFLIFRENELEQKHKMIVVDTFSKNREIMMSHLDIHCDQMSFDVEEKLNSRNNQLENMQYTLDGALRTMLRKLKSFSQAQADMKRQLQMSEQQLAAKEQLVDTFKKSQNDTLLSTKEVLLWASSCCNEILSSSGIAPLPSLGSFETIPESLLYIRDQVDAAIDTLQKVNDELKGELKQKNESLVLAHKKQARLEADLADYKMTIKLSNGQNNPHGLSTPQQPSGHSRVNFQNISTPRASDKALAFTGDFSATTPASASRGQGTPSTKELSKLQSELRKERKRLHSLRDQHEELLGLLAQQELEMKSFRDKLYDYCGKQIVIDTEEEIKREAVERYGSYIDFRHNEEDSSFGYAAGSPGPLVSSQVPKSPEVV